VLRHRLALLQVQVADRFVMHDAALAADDGDGACDVLPVHELLHAGADLQQFVGRDVLAAGGGSREGYQQQTGNDEDRSGDAWGLHGCVLRVLSVLPIRAPSVSEGSAAPLAHARGSDHRYGSVTYFFRSYTSLPLT